MTPQRNPFVEAYWWNLHVPSLVTGLSRHQIADLESFRDWLSRRHPEAATLALMAGFLFSGDMERAVGLIYGYRDWLLETGRSPATVNRHLTTLRWLARTARDMGRTDYDLAGVAGIHDGNRLSASEVTGTAGPESLNVQSTL